MPELRKASRREYLKKRKEDKLMELEDDIRDDEYLFDESQLTQREREDRAYKKKLLDLANRHKRAGDVEKVQRYHMPDKGRKEGREHTAARVIKAFPTTTNLLQPI